MKKYLRSNQDTTVNQMPLVQKNTGGSIWLKSKPGEGTTVFISLALAGPSEGKAGAPRAGATAA